MQCYSIATSSIITTSSTITPSSSIISRSSSITTSIIISATPIIITRRRSLPRRSLSGRRSLPLWWISSRMINCLIVRFTPNYILSFRIAIYNLLLPSPSQNMILRKISLFVISVYIDIIPNLIMILFIWPFLKWYLFYKTRFLNPILITGLICILKSQSFKSVFFLSTPIFANDCRILWINHFSTLFYIDCPMTFSTFMSVFITFINTKR